MAAVLSVLLVFGVRSALDPFLRELSPFALFFVPVLLMGWWAGPGPATLAAILGWFIADWFFCSPRHAILLSGAQEFTASLVYVAISTALVAVTHSMRQARRQVEKILGSIRSREEQLQVALGAGRMGTWVWDTAAGTVQTDALHRTLWEIDNDQPEVPEDLIFSRIHPEDVGKVFTRERLTTLQGPFELEFRIRSHTGQVRWLRGAARLLGRLRNAAMEVITLYHDKRGCINVYSLKP